MPRPAGTQTGHLVGRTNKRRASVAARPVAVAYALVLGYLTGLRGSFLLDSTVDGLVRRQRNRISRRPSPRRCAVGFVDLRQAGGLVEIGFNGLAGVLR